MKKLYVLMAIMILLSSCGPIFQGYSCPNEKTVVNAGSGYHKKPPALRFK